MTPYDNTLRWLTRRVIIDGVEHKLAIVELIFADEKWHINVQKFERETHSTAYHPGTIQITTYKDSRKKPLLEFFDYICIANVFFF